MQSRRRVSAPAARVYEAGPALQQAKFKSPPKSKKKRVISYGKKTTVRVPKPKDNTLTQMGFVMDNTPPDLDPEEEDDDYEEAAEKRKTKRRKTMGDQPSATATPQFHTQTISQVVRSFSSAHDLEEDQESEQKPEKERDIFDVPSSSPAHRQREAAPRRGRSVAPGKENQPPATVAQVSKAPKRAVQSAKSKDQDLMPPPQTPRRVRTLEIPSSESPATPLSLNSYQNLSRFPLLGARADIPIDFGEREALKGGFKLENSERGSPTSTKSRKPATFPAFLSNGRDSKASHLAKIDDPGSTNFRKPVNSPPFYNDSKTSEASPDLGGIRPDSTPDGKPDKPIFFNPNPRRNPHISPEKAPKLEIRDTYDTATDISQITHVPSSPAKSVRLAIPDGSPETETSVSPVRELVSVVAPQPPSSRTIKTEILDSDAESEDEDHVEEEEHVEQEETVDLPEDAHMSQEKEYVPDSPVREDINEADRDQMVGNNEVKLEELIELPDHRPVGSKKVPESPERADSHADDGESDYGDIGAETQFQVEKLTSSSGLNAQPEDTHSDETAPDSAMEKTQYMETQRINTQHVNAMPARTGESDVFISFSSAELTSVLDRTRNHLIRNWKLPPKVCRVWIYETKPVCQVQYMADISSVKRPGDLPEFGVGNTGFNARVANTTYNAYEIMQVYELLDPVRLNTLLEKGWFEAVPKKWAKVAPAVTDELVCNLKPPLFQIDDESPSSSDTATQEVAGQLMSNIQQFTQAAEMHSGADADVDIERVPSSPLRLSAHRVQWKEDTARKQERELPPSQATTVDLSQTQTPRHQRHHSVDIIMESPTRPTPVEIPSSTPQLPRHRTPRSGRGHVREPQPELESLVPYSMASSELQLLTRSQLLSDTLLQDSVPGPPECVGDSEDEEDDIYDDDI